MPTPLQSHFDKKGSWSELWQIKKTPWDRGFVSPSLVELIEEKKFPVIPDNSRENAATPIGVVPGCGKGYDVAYLSRALDAKVYGYDIAPEAVELAKAQYPDTNNGRINFLVADFFKELPEGVEGRVNFGFDYTFLCALHPSLRPTWAARWSEVMKPGGHLIALMHPITGHQGGPPYALTPELYQELLGGKFERVYFEKPGKTHEGESSAKDMMSVWRRK
ncbi:hypothetical protein YB2330_005908 [Saitoella coloradoensis]